MMERDDNCTKEGNKCQVSMSRGLVMEWNGLLGGQAGWGGWGEGAAGYVDVRMCEDERG